MRLINKIIILLGSFFVIAVFTGTWFAAPAQAGLSTESDGWKMIMSFSNALRDMQDRTEAYRVVYVGLLVLLAVFIGYLYLMQKRIEKNKQVIPTPNEGTSGKRKFMRLAVDQEFFYARALERTYRKAKVINLSGGGILFATAEKFQQNEELKVVMELFPDVVIRLRANVVRVTENNDPNTKQPYVMGLQFKDIKNTDQDRIIKRILKEQQEIVIEEKRKLKNLCVFCGEPLPEEAIGIRTYCPHCVDYETDKGS
jgi:RNA polymerase-binding transcription factor DksA